MSDPRAKAERSEAKDIRQGVQPQTERPQRVRKRIEKPFEVWHYWSLYRGYWRRDHKYATREQAEAHIAKWLRYGEGVAGLREGNKNMYTAEDFRILDANDPGYDEEVAKLKDVETTEAPSSPSVRVIRPLKP